MNTRAATPSRDANVKHVPYRLLRKRKTAVFTAQNVKGRRRPSQRGRCTKEAYQPQRSPGLKRAGSIATLALGFSAPLDAHGALTEWRECAASGFDRAERSLEVDLVRDLREKYRFHRGQTHDSERDADR